MVFHGGGRNGHPITIEWEPGSTLSSPDWHGGAAINTNGYGDITFNGGSDGSIQATEEGSGLPDQGIPSKGIFALDCTGCTFENLTIENLYRHTSETDTSVDQTEDNAIEFSGSRITIAHNTIHDVGWALFSRWSSGDGENRIYGNNIYRVDHGFAATADGIVGPMFFYDNHVHDYANWDTVTGGYHHDGLHCFGPQDGATYKGLYIYDNRFDGSVGAHVTAQIFIEGNYGKPGDTPCAALGSTIDIFNNVVTSTDSVTSNGYIQTSQSGGGLYNNTIVGVNKTQNVGGCFNYSGNASGTTVAFLNNALSTCDFLINGTSGMFTSGSPNYNVYANGGDNSFVCEDNFYNFNQFRSWRSCMRADQHSVRSSSAKLSADDLPLRGSPLIGEAENLTPLCHGALAPLCRNISGTPRPERGPWNAGAY